TYGALTLNGDGTFSYTHNGSENFTDGFTYRVTDNDGESSSATVMIEVIADNSPPTASDINIDVLEDLSITGNLPAAIDDDGDTVTYRLVQTPTHGSVTVEVDGGFSYAPEADYHGTDSFSYSVSDGNGGYNSYLVGINVVSVNDAPVITSHGDDDSVLLSMAENSTLVTRLNAVDVENDRITFALDGGADLGLFAIDPMSGELRFVNAPDMENPSDADQDNLYQVQVLVADGNGGTDRQFFSIEVTDVDEFDVGLLLDMEALPDRISHSASLDDGVGITVWAEDPDCSNNQITYSLDDDANGLFAIDPSSGVVTLASVVESGDALRFEITVRATSEDGSYSLKSFSISLLRSVENPPEPEEPYLDDIIDDLEPDEPVKQDNPASVKTEEIIGQPAVPTAVDGMTGNAQTEDLSDRLLQGVVDYPTQAEAEKVRDVVDRFEQSLFSTEGRSSHGFGFMKMQLTPTPVSPDELPQLNTMSDELIEVPDIIWSLLDTMNQEMSEHRSEQASDDGIVLQSATFGTLALSAGYVAWLLRAGVLSASLLSFSPLWRQIDPLPVLSAHAKRRDETQESLPEEEADDRRVAQLFERKKKPKQGRSFFSRKDA
ncbi:MAG: Ig-like domain-containing protein, partial [Candidatus Thiodiazotropha sp.]